MDFGEKLQQLRKKENLTQEELAQKLFVSRTAVSKWESGRGLPSIDSLKAISDLFEISLDSLLSTNQLLQAAENDNRKSFQHTKAIVFALMDISLAVFFFLPFFGEKIDGVIYEIPVTALRQIPSYLKIPYLVITAATILYGIITLALQNCENAVFEKYKNAVSVCLSAIACFMFIISLQPYAASMVFVFLLIKMFLIIKKP